jgi:hypothetical protein
VSFFVRVEIHEGRTGLGIGICLLAIISLVALTTPGGDYLAEDQVATHGGYVGGAIAWLLATPTSPAIAAVLLVGLLIVGLVITGLSISGLVDSVRARFAVDYTEPPRAKSKQQPERPTLQAPLDEGGGPSDQPAVLPTRAVASSVDSEAARKTVPVPKTVAPRAMEGFLLPPPMLLRRTSESAAMHKSSDNELRATANVISDTLATFDIPARS